MTRIEGLHPPTGPHRPWTVVLTGGEKLRVREGVVIDYALHAEMDLDEDLLARIRSAARQAELRETTVSLLTRRLISSGTLREKLLDKGATEDQAEQLVNWAMDIGLLSDEHYARQLVRHYQAKGYGLYRIREELRRRKVPREHWEQALDQLAASDAAIDIFLTRKLPDPSDPRQVKRAADALARRGFSWSEISDGIERARRRAEDEGQNDSFPDE